MLFAQNDGTLMDLDFAARFPILTIGSGPANSIRGAAFLTGMTDALVADVGGTSTDFGMIVNGFPRESAYAVDIGGVTTNFRMPDVLAIPLGGGTVVREGDGGARLGPDSVGYRLPSDALVFGGATPTLTDAAVVAGRGTVGHKQPPSELEALLLGAVALIGRRDRRRCRPDEARAGRRTPGRGRWRIDADSRLRRRGLESPSARPP